MEQKFTQEIKDNWLKALKSGKYKQGFGQLYHKPDNSFCCIGVLGDIMEDLDNEHSSSSIDTKSPYVFLRNTIGRENTDMLCQHNDRIQYGLDDERKYSNVIPLIEKLPIQV